MSSKTKTSADPNSNRRRDYEVGFGKPPKSTQFKQGGGSKKARPPKEEVTHTSVFRAVAAEVISITVGGQQRKIRFDQAVLLVNQQKALEGHPAASRNIKKFLDMGGFIPTWSADANTGIKLLVPQPFETNEE